MVVETRYIARRERAMDRLGVIYRQLLELLQAVPETDLERFTRLVNEAKDIHGFLKWGIHDIEVWRLDECLAYYTLQHVNRHRRP